MSLGKDVTEISKEQCLAGLKAAQPIAIEEEALDEPTLNGKSVKLPQLTKELQREQSQFQVKPVTVSLPVTAYYDSTRKEYLIQNRAGRWHSHDQSQFKLQLRARGYSTTKPPDGLVSQAEQEMLRIQNQCDVQYAGALAGRKAGFYDENGTRLLVTSSPQTIAGVAGPWPMLEKVIRNMIASESEPWTKEQWIVFNGWMKVARHALLAGMFQPGQALAIAGEVDSGKSLLQALITEALGGRAAKAAMFLQGRTDFNSELFGAEHLVLEDESASTSHVARAALGAAIKAIAVNKIHPCHGKRRDIVNLFPWRRLTISLNDEPERMLILPRLTSDVSDKIILLRAIRHPMPEATDTTEQKDSFWSKLMAELPGYLHWLEREFRIPDEWISPRFGIKHFHHPELVQSLDELSPAITLLELIDQLEPWGKTDNEWEGTATELRQKLLENERTRRDAARLLNWENACGQYLGELAKIKSERVHCTRTKHRRNWLITAP